MLAFAKPLPPCHGTQGVSHSSSYHNFALEVNKRGPTPFQRSRFGTQQRMPLSPVRPKQGGVQNSASSVCWAKEEEDPLCIGKGDMGGWFFGDDDPCEEFEEVDMEDELELLLEEVSEMKKARRDKEAKEELAFDEQVSNNIDATLFDHMPPACDLAWKDSQQAWLDLAINHPISLNKGGCSVHILGICHGVPTNASALKALVDAVQPDTIAIEQSPQDSKKLWAVAQELAPQLDKLMALAIPAGIREAHMALSPQGRYAWRLAAFELDHARPNTIDWTPIYYGSTRYGMVPAIEFVAAAHLARNNRISLEGIDLDEGCIKREVLSDPEYEEEYDQQMVKIRGSEDFSARFHRSVSVYLIFFKWLFKTQQVKADMDGSMSLFQAIGHHQFLLRLANLSKTPADTEREMHTHEEACSHMTGRAATYAMVQMHIRNLKMLDHLQQFAEGGRKCIVAVVGRAHVAPMRELAERNKV